MGTRANIIVTDGERQLWVYRSHDGNPSFISEDLKKIMRWISQRKILNEVSDIVGWLIILGIDKWPIDADGDPTRNRYSDYEVTTGLHEDIDYLYVLNHTKLSCMCYSTWPKNIKSAKDLENTKGYDFFGDF